MIFQQGNSGVSGMQSVGEGGEKEVEFISNDGSKIEVLFFAFVNVILYIFWTHIRNSYQS